MVVWRDPRKKKNVKGVLVSRPGREKKERYLHRWEGVRWGRGVRYSHSKWRSADECP